ncbi:MAG: hypothetical protein ISP41_04820 [Alphaproteobacteria bacterium]|jgi:endonuclease YncB( thermonuclease family)|nr:hypothetical protein [Alphaproteobacteria bacterium]
MRSKRIIAWVVSGILLASGLSALVLHAQADDDKVIEGKATVIDAGTIKIGDKVVKLQGVITPGARQKCRKGSLPWLCGAAARTHLVKLVEDKTIRCLKSGPYHARCFEGSVDLAKSLARNGWAVAAKDGLIYRDAEDAARADKLGMWQYAD